MIWRSSNHKRVVQLIDFFVAISSVIISYKIRVFLNNIYPNIFSPAFEYGKEHIILLLIWGIIVVQLFNRSHAYNYQRFKSFNREIIIALKVGVLSNIMLVIIVFIFGFRQFPRIFLVINTLTCILLFISEKWIMTIFVAKLRGKGIDRKRILIVGSGERSINFIKVVKMNFNWGLDIIGLLTDEKSEIGNSIEGISILNVYSNLQKVLKDYNPDEIIITISSNRFDQIREILKICENEGVIVRLNSDFLGHITKSISSDKIYGINIISFYPIKMDEFDQFVKRIIDIVGASIALMLFLPFMILAVFIIYFSDGYPIFYSFMGYGLNKKPIKIYKFRTMVKNADILKDDLINKNEMSGPVFKISNDPRVIKNARFLRRFSIDETPQLFSVLKGDLSLVGPRQAMSHEFEKYESWQRRKLSVKPGLTCLWQVHGRNKISSFDDWVKMDLEYIDNWSIMLDIKILLKTIPTVLFGRGAS